MSSEGRRRWAGPRLTPRSALLGCVLAIAPSSIAVVAAATSAAAPLTEQVDWISVSPAYLRSGVVVVSSHVASGCQQDCVHIWVSHDRGASWQRSAAAGWRHGRAVVVLDGAGRELLLADDTTSSVQRSSDLGATWSDVGAAGNGTAAPSYARDGAIAVAGTSRDAIVSASGVHAVTGSGGSMHDAEFAFAPVPFGSRAPVLLSGVDAHSGAPLVERCDASLSCAGPVALPGGTQWSGAAMTMAFSSAYAGDGVVFAATGLGVYKSSDGGASFAPLSVAPGASATGTPMLALGPGYAEHGASHSVFVAVVQIVKPDSTSGGHTHTSGGVYRSSDGGATFTSLGSPGALDHGATAVAVAPDGRLFAGYLNFPAGAGLVCNDGSGWMPLCGAAAGTSGTKGAAAGAGASACATSRCPVAPSPPPSAGGTGVGASGPTSAGVPSLQAGAHTTAPSGHSWLAVAIVAAAVAMALAAAGGLRAARRR